MKTLAEIQKVLQQKKPILVEKYGVKELGVFGSYVRGEQKNASDLDVLVELEEPIRMDLIAFIEMENYLSDLLGMKVDLVMKEDLKPRIGKHVLSEVRSV
ncbi:MAG: nucleotidyltransferase family protein [Candidatus Latescibacterota bacterium]